MFLPFFLAVGIFFGITAADATAPPQDSPFPVVQEQTVSPSNFNKGPYIVMVDGHKTIRSDGY